jgi:hypothetical protein
MLPFRFLSSGDRLIYVVCSLIGFVVMLALRPAVWGPYAATLVTYHLFLASMMYLSEKKLSRSNSLGVTIAGHLGLIALLVAVRLAIHYGVLSFLESLPRDAWRDGAYLTSRVTKLAMFFATYGIAELEKRWLFDGERKSQPEDMSTLEPMMVELYAKHAKHEGPLVVATGVDHDEWVRYCARRSSKYYDPSNRPQDDFEQWLRARGKTQYSVTGFGETAEATSGD